LKFKFLADRKDAIPVVAKWYFEEWGYHVPGNSIDQTIVRITGKLDCNKLPLYILAIEDKRVLGVAQLKQYEMDIYPEKEFWLGGLFVSPIARGRGIGSSLANKITTVAASLNVKEIYLQTEALDGGLYHQLGWQPIETVRSKGFDVTVMVRKLDI
jgi:GNAT superfamily N-acetyltransferase